MEPGLKHIYCTPSPEEEEAPTDVVVTMTNGERRSSITVVES
jgi:hypothetical protein